MKRTIISLALLSCAVYATQAQTVYEAINLMDNQYYGTARSVALGNAVSALGGDLGMIGINPAGSAVAGYSQMAITPNLNFGTVSSTYAPVGEYSPNYYQGKTAASQNTRFMFSMPNVGFTIRTSDGGGSALKNLTFSFVANSAGLYNDFAEIGGLNDCFTSMTGSLSSQCSGYYPEALSAAYNSNMYWPYQLAYKAGLIRYLDGSTDQYAGAAEIWDDTYMVGAPLEQRYTRDRRGSKTEMLFNMAANFNDKLYVGLNIGVPTSTITTSLTMTENALNAPGTMTDIVYFLDDELVRFNRAGFSQWERINTTGVYAKAGLIFVPVQGVRLAAAIQTPTATRVSRRVQWDGYSDYSKVNTGAPFSFNSKTPDGEEQYRITAPFRYNLGAAFTFGQFLLLSVDWESVDFRQMSFRGVNGSDTYQDVNREIANYAGMNNTVRFGIEGKPVPQLALRAGYNFKTNMFAGAKDVTRIFSFGAGYSSNGSFYCDVAARRTGFPSEYYYPYADYIFDSDGSLLCGVPEMVFDKKMWDVMFTFGWRF